MPVTTNIIQPAIGSFNPAYRPIYFRVQATTPEGYAVPPAVYADIYVNGTYYRTLSKLYPARTFNVYSEWEFDIQSAVQEVLSPYLFPIGNAVPYIDPNTIAPVDVSFRSSGLDTNGFMVPEGPVPVQGTGTTQPTPGGGTISNDFLVVNSTLKHTDNQNLTAHLDTYKMGEWNAAAHPFTHRPDGYLLCAGDSDAFPVLIEGGSIQIAVIRVLYKTKATNTVQVLNSPITPVGAHLLQVPAGPANLSLPADVWEYVVQGIDGNGDVVFTTPTYRVGGCCDGNKRIVFQNYLGSMDAINFKYLTEDHETKSDGFQKPAAYPLGISQHTVNRSNTVGFDTITVRTTDYREENMEWIKECLDSGKAWEVLNGQYVPIIILDGSQTTRKEEGRYIYEVVLKYRYSNELITQRQ